MNFSKKFFSCLIFAFPLVFGSLIAAITTESIYTKTIESVNYNNIGNLIIVNVQLSDHSAWYLPIDVMDEKKLADIEKKLIKDKEVYILPNPNKRTYYLYNLDNSRIGFMYKVGITKDTLKNYPNRLVNMEKYLIKKGGWFTSDVYGTKITLTDGSIWNITDGSHGEWRLREWSTNDRVIVSKNKSKETTGWILINIDAGYGGFNENDYRCILSVIPASE